MLDGVGCCLDKDSHTSAQSIDFQQSAHQLVTAFLECFPLMLWGGRVCAARYVKGFNVPSSSLNDHGTVSHRPLQRSVRHMDRPQTRSAMLLMLCTRVPSWGFWMSVFQSLKILAATGAAYCLQDVSCRWYRTVTEASYETGSHWVVVKIYII